MAFFIVVDVNLFFMASFMIEKESVLVESESWGSSFTYQKIQNHHFSSFKITCQKKKWFLTFFLLLMFNILILLGFMLLSYHHSKGLDEQSKIKYIYAQMLCV